MSKRLQTKFMLVEKIERVLRHPSRRLWMCDKETLERILGRLRARRRPLVVTVWRNLSGGVECHADAPGAFDAKIDPHAVGEVLHRFTI